MESQINTCIIGIGSNIDADANIPKMLRLLGNAVEIVKVSSFVKTKPIGGFEQPDYTNGAVKIRTPLSKSELKKLLVGIEVQLGRNRQAPGFSARTMDLDIVVWNGKVVDEDYYARDFLKKSVDEVGH